MWGPSIVVFGSYRYKGASGREGDWFLTGFSPRKENLTLYLISGFKGAEGLLKNWAALQERRLFCLYLKSLADVDLEVLRQLVERSVAETRKRSA